MKMFLTITALMEGLTGISLLVFPSFVSTLLLNSSITESSGILVGRVAGAALMSLALNCWYSRNDLKVTGLNQALLFYNFSVALILTYGAIYLRFNGNGMWPAVLYHFVFGIWSFRIIYKRKKLSF